MRDTFADQSDRRLGSYQFPGVYRRRYSGLSEPGCDAYRSDRTSDDDPLCLFLDENLPECLL